MNQDYLDRFSIECSGVVSVHRRDTENAEVAQRGAFALSLRFLCVLRRLCGESLPLPYTQRKRQRRRIAAARYVGVLRRMVYREFLKSPERTQFNSPAQWAGNCATPMPKP